MMQGLQDPQTSRKTELNRGSDAMNVHSTQATTGPAPLYASPWLAFFYLIRQGWSASGSDAGN